MVENAQERWFKKRKDLKISTFIKALAQYMAHVNGNFHSDDL